MKKLSIITCTYNSEKYLQKSIDSVIQQNIDPNIFEHIFIDWESKDSTISIINAYKKSHPQYNIKMISAKPQGIYNAMNIWRKHAQWEYVNFLNSDDQYVTDSIWDYLKYIHDTWSKDFYYAQAKIIDKNNKIISTVPDARIFKNIFNTHLLLITCYINHQTVIMKNKLCESYWYFDETKKIVSDLAYYIQLSKNSTSRSYYDNPTILFLTHEDGASAQRSRNISEYNAIRNKELWSFFGRLYYTANILLFNNYISYCLLKYTKGIFSIFLWKKWE